MKKLISLILALAALFVCIVPAFASETASPWYINTTRASATLSIDENGLASITLLCTAKSSVDSIIISSYLEKKSGNSWVRVEIDEQDDTWVDSASSNYLYKTHSFQLDASGEYQLVSTFTVSASESETFTITSTSTY